MLQRGKYYKIGDLAMEIVSEPRDIGDKVGCIVRFYNIAAMSPFFVNSQYVEMLKTGIARLKELPVNDVMRKKQAKAMAMPEWVTDVYKAIKKS